MELPGRRFNLLDALRGSAALAVVFWHWQHFFGVPYTDHQIFERSDQPLYEIFKLFYDHGWLAVDLFFLLSGFIFFWLYSRKIAEHAISARDFLVLRFSRLYPLHMLTLICVVVGQLAYSRIDINSSSFVYRNNDLLHFLLNILMLPAVGLERGYSFNGPFWSVSVEIVLYGLFYIFSLLALTRCRSRVRLLFVLGIMSAGGFLFTQVYDPLGRGVSSFFLGGALYILFEFVSLSVDDGRRGWRWIVVASALAWAATIFLVYTNRHLADISFLSSIDARFLNRLPHLVLFPLTVISLALLDKQIRNVPRIFSSLGNISYSSYLWHFPLQLGFVILIKLSGQDRSFFEGVPALVLFFMTLIGVSHLSFYWIEMPAQRFLRRWLMVRSLSQHNPS